MKNTKIATILLCLSTFFGCSHPEQSGHKEMVKLLAELATKNNKVDNHYASSLRVDWYAQEIAQAKATEEKWGLQFKMGREALNAGQSEKAIQIFSDLKKEMEEGTANQTDISGTIYLIDRHLALANLRVGEQANCLHHRSKESCILPIRDGGVHEFKSGSRNAAKIYHKLLQENPNDVEHKWLLNLAYQTIGNYPDSVPEEFLIEPTFFSNNQDNNFTFEEIAQEKGVDTNQLSGGSIIEDFNNDGILDIMSSSWGLGHQLELFLGQPDFSYTRATQEARLIGITGGLNMMQTDYNNDGWVDVFILRGAWREKAGHLPNSLLKNNGNGTFTDVTITTGLLTMLPTQAATWGDFNNDGWLDVFIANETYDVKNPLPAQLFINNGKGSFKNKSAICGTDIIGYFKGATSADYDKDGLLDIFVTNLKGKDYLLKNIGINEDGLPQFKEVSEEAGIIGSSASFPTCFFDYDQDGWEDLMVFSLNFQKRDALKDAIKDFLGKNVITDKAKLYHNNGDGTFSDVSNDTKTDRVILAMGANFGDIDNDGYPDFYAGTGTPNLNTIIPNRMFINNEGKAFEETSFGSRTAHIQKGHGVSFGDIDADGDLDIHITMGGAMEGDVCPNVLFRNDLSNDKNWIKLKLIGTKSNKAAIGSSIEIIGSDNGNIRHFYKTVTSGGSFGASPFQQHIGLNYLTKIDTLRITWHRSNEIQEFYDLNINTRYQIEEGGEVDI